jgi:hypothetical protein
MSNHLVKTVELRCDDRAENLVLTRYDWDDGDDPNFELCIEDSYCGGTCVGLAGRFKRAWHAFRANPITYSGVYITDPKRLLKFLQDGIALVEGAEKI